MSQTDGHPTLLFNIQSSYQSDAGAESFLPIEKLQLARYQGTCLHKSIKRGSSFKVYITFRIVAPVIGQHLLKSFKAHLNFAYNAGNVYPFLVYEHGSFPQSSQDLYCRTDIR